MVCSVGLITQHRTAHRGAVYREMDAWFVEHTGSPDQLVLQFVEMPFLAEQAEETLLSG